MICNQRRRLHTRLLSCGIMFIFVFNYISGEYTCAEGTKNYMFGGYDACDRVPQSPIFSHSSGFYDVSFLLSIESKEGQCKIYYTMDCSDPDEKSMLYIEPILIEDRSHQENRYSNLTNVSAYFNWANDQIDKEEEKYRIPAGRVEKWTIVKAICIDEAGKKSEIQTATYFVGFNTRNEYDNVGVLSIYTEPDDLFGYNDGIYITGLAFDKEYNKEKENRGWWWWPANYHKKSKEYERKAVIEIFDKEHNIILSKKVGLRIKGGASRALLPKSLNIYARAEYDGLSEISYDLFDTGFFPQRVSLFCGGNDNELMIQDFLVSKLASNMNISTLNFIPYNVFLEGEYWGFTWMTEKYDEDFFSYYYNVKKNNVVMIKNNKVELGSDEDWKLFQQMLDFVMQNDMSNERNYQYIMNMIDIDSFIDYYSVEILINNRDWDMKRNYACWRTRKTKKNEYSDGRWRWILFDVNYLITDDDVEEDAVNRTRNQDILFNGLMNNDQFKTTFLHRLYNTSEQFLDALLAEELIVDYKRIFTQVIMSYQRFHNGKELIAEDVNEYLSRLKKRIMNVLDYCEKNLQSSTCLSVIDKHCDLQE